MKKTQKRIDQLKKLSVIEKHQQVKIKGGIDKSKVKIPGE